MRFKYKVVKGLSFLIKKACYKIRDTKDIMTNLRRLKWFDKKQHLSLKDYQFHFNDFCQTPNTLILDEVICKLDELVKSKSKLANYDELKSDIKWLKEYYEKNLGMM